MYACEYGDRYRLLYISTYSIYRDNGDYDGSDWNLSSAQAAIYELSTYYSIFKSGNRVNIGIEYSDYAGRIGAVNKADSSSLFIPNSYELSGFKYNNIINSLTLSIKNIPPIWAYSYRVLIDKNIPWFFQFYFNGMANGDPDIVDDNIHYNININRSIQSLREYLPKSTLSPYIS